MHLIKGVCTLNTRKPKQKITKAKQIQLEQEFKEHNKFLKSIHMPKITFEEYVDQVFGRVNKQKKKTDSLVSSTPIAYRANTYASVTSTAKNINSCAKKEAQVYSGEQKLLGIATLHKSNMVPVFAKQDAVDIANMRRN
jgi:predicted nuclease with TOPRIM domain